jgi:polyisoprenoid-binding protein YceI
MRTVRLSTSGVLTLFVLALVHSAVTSLRGQDTRPDPKAEIVLTFDPAQSKIHWTVDSSLHTVHGTFDLDSGTLHLDPQTGKAAGEIVVHAKTGQSGNDSRDARMHKEILQIAKYPDVVFRPTQLEGKLASSGSTDGKLHGLLVIHAGSMSSPRRFTPNWPETVGREPASSRCLTCYGESKIQAIFF